MWSTPAVMMMPWKSISTSTSRVLQGLWVLRFFWAFSAAFKFASTVTPTLASSFALGSVLILFFLFINIFKIKRQGCIVLLKQRSTSRHNIKALPLVKAEIWQWIWLHTHHGTSLFIYLALPNYLRQGDHYSFSINNDKARLPPKSQ